MQTNLCERYYFYCNTLVNTNKKYKIAIIINYKKAVNILVVTMWKKLC